MYAIFESEVASSSSNKKSTLPQLSQRCLFIPCASMEYIFLNLTDWSLPISNPVFVMCVLLVTVLTVPTLMQRLRLPGIVGLILAGAILGPHGVNLLKLGEGIQLLSKIGLLYIMFWAGLEVDMVSFLKNKHKSATFGLLTFSLPLVLGGLCSYYILGLGWMGALLLASMFSTHTLISYPIVNRLQIARDESVAISVGGTIITDTLALLLLAVITGMAQEAMDAWFWVRLIVSLAVFAALVFGLLPRIAKWFFRRVESDITYQFVFVLAMVFVSGLLAEVAGVEAIIGAFLAGLVLNRLIPHSSSLMNRIEFIGNSLFIPVFLFSVGMLVNLHVFFNNEKTIFAALVLTSMALFTKWLAAFFTQKIFGYSSNQGRLIFGLSSSHAAATIAIVLIGYNIKLFDETVLNATIFLILITCLVSSFVTDRAAKSIAAASIHDRILTHETQRILVPIANPATVVNLVDFAFLIKTKGKTEPVYPLSIILDEKDAREKIRQSQLLIEPMMRHAHERGISLSPIHRVDVSAVSGILRAANELLATEIVIGWQPKASASDRLFGTLLDNLLEESPEMLFVTNLQQSPFKFKKLRAIICEGAHLEPRFAEILQRIENISLHLNLPIKLIVSANTSKSVESLLSKNNLERLKIEPLEKENWWKLHKNHTPDELAILVSARQGSVSYEPFMDKIPAYLAEHFSESNFVLAYPAM